MLSIEKIDFATKPAIALQQVRETLDGGITTGIVLVGAAYYGTVTLWREQLAEWGLSYCVDVPEGISA
ncbi:transposase [Halomonas janggokensis]|nr:transposase [Halomonas janggokensis]MDR5886080.1 transposase [Halomonas janggokensis]